MATSNKGEAKIIHHGLLGFNKGGNIDFRYFVLSRNGLDYFNSYEDATNGGARGGHLVLDDVEEMEVTESGFLLTLVGSRRMELICKSIADLQPWIDALQPFFDGEEEEEGDAQDGCVEEDVQHDSPLQVEIDGARRMKHFWLLTDRLEYTNTEEEEEPEDSFPLKTMKGVTVTATGFEIQSGTRTVKLFCDRSSSQRWVEELKKAFSANAKNLKSKQGAVSPSSPADNPKVAPNSQPKAVQSPNNREPQGAPQQQQQAAPSEATKQTNAARSAPAQVLSPVSPTAASTSSTPRSVFQGTANQRLAEEEEENRLDQSSSSGGRRPLCKGELGVAQKGREDKRYFALFEDTFDYWLTGVECERGDKPRGSVRTDSIAYMETNSSGYRGFTLYFESSNRLELRCLSEQHERVWIEQWKSVLEMNKNGSEQKASQPGLSGSASVPNFNAQTALPALQSPQPSNSQRSVSPVASARTKKDWQDMPGLVFMGSLMIEMRGRTKRRHFALFDNRLDYFERLEDLTAERYPKGRILLRDIASINFTDNGYQLVFDGLDLPSMMLIAEPDDLPTWKAAWAKVGMPQQQRQQSPVRGNISKGVPVLEGKLHSMRPQPSGSGSLEPRYVILYLDRIDCFLDQKAAEMNRPMESMLTSEIRDIDVIEGGFNMVSSSRASRPLKLRCLPGVSPDVDQWVDALRKVFDS